MSTSLEAAKAILDKNGEMMAFLLSVDEKESIMDDPEVFLSLMKNMAFPPCRLLLDAALPTDSILCDDAALRT